jgi:glyoxylase-like metal-dependent hydrolase (beta-lactamase superfamily II)
MISIKTLVFNPFSENTFILYDETKECLIIDPGCYTVEEQEHLSKIIERESLTPVGLVNTHCHIDHVLGNAYVKTKYHLQLQIPEGDYQTLTSVTEYAATYGFPNYEPAMADVLLKEGQLINFGNSQLSTLLVPGHTAGHVAFYNKEDKICIGGDVLFDGSIGRTDLPGGDFDVLISSIREQLFTLPEDTVVYPGHGRTTTIGHEKKTNPYAQLSSK